MSKLIESLPSLIFLNIFIISVHGQYGDYDLFFTQADSDYSTQRPSFQETSAFSSLDQTSASSDTANNGGFFPNLMDELSVTFDQTIETQTPAVNLAQITSRRTNFELEFPNISVEEDQPSLGNQLPELLLPENFMNDFQTTRNPAYLFETTNEELEVSNGGNIEYVDFETTAAVPRALMTNPEKVLRSGFLKNFGV